MGSRIWNDVIGLRPPPGAQTTSRGSAHLQGLRPPPGAQTTSRGSLSAADTATATLSGSRTASFSRNTARKPRSLLLWSLSRTLVPLSAASSTSWWDISPEGREDGG
ncbi:hypothetical protein EYF80_057178 [Liparis tanakae]|uniref:Uncharacterized protein n=1 Tax=Liparis tanakae TaxID=230148 RepID=A0A4Z2EVT0_9TELE|nr:hypothetical protein EYF80_057178 [Liparis tanakae]